MDKYYNLQEIANNLKVTRQTVYNWIKAGKLKAVKIGKEYRVTEKDIKEFTQAG